MSEDPWNDLVVGTDAHRFFERLPNEVAGAGVVSAALALDAARIESSGVRGRSRVFGRAALVAAARARFGSCVCWMGRIERLQADRAASPSAAEQSARIPAELKWQRSYHWCAACDARVAWPEQHVRLTRGCCGAAPEKRWEPLGAPGANELADVHWCLWCREAVPSGQRFEHTSQRHFGIAYAYREDLLLPGVRVGHAGLLEARRIVGDTPEVAAWADLWETAHVLGGADVGRVVAHLRKPAAAWDGKTVCAVVGAGAGARFQIRQKLKGSGVVVASRGDEHARVLLAWREADVERELCRHLPGSVVRGCITPAVREMYAQEDARHLSKPRPPRGGYGYGHRRSTCDSCGASSDDVEILACVHVRERYCDACIDADEELSCHKWEEM